MHPHTLLLYEASVTPSGVSGHFKKQNGCGKLWGGVQWEAGWNKYEDLEKICEVAVGDISLLYLWMPNA